MKKLVYSMEQIERIVAAIDSLQIKGIAQANAIVVCQQVIEKPLEVIDEEEEGGGEQNES